MIALLATHAVMAVLAPGLVRLWGRRAFWVLALPPAAAAVWGAAMTYRVSAGNGPTELARWVPSLDLELAFRMDTLSWLMVLVVGGVGALVLAYCGWYFDDSEPGLGRFAG